MESLQAIALGAPPKDPDEGDSRVANAMAVLERGFPEGAVISLCLKCQKFEEFGLDEAAVMMVDHTWPTCCGIRTVMDDQENAPKY